MPIMNTLRANHRLRDALIVGVGLLVIASGGGIAFAQNERQETPYRSSIQVAHDDDDNESTDAEEDKKGMESDDGRDASGDEAEDAAEKTESTRYQSLARITAAQAGAAAAAKVPGTVTAAVLENEDGNLVYGVSIRTASGERDVKVDAGNGKVLHIETDDRD